MDRRADDQGMAMAIALIFGMLIMIMAASALTIATGGLRKADTDQDWNGALSAAYAGIQEYQSRLANDNTYYQYGNKDAPLTKSSGSSSTVTLPTGTQTNPAFGIGTAGTWATVAGSNGTSSFRYEIDNSKYAGYGTIRVRSTGRVGTETRSVTADLRQDGFIDYLYFTNYEIQDPDVSGVPQSGSKSCLRYAYQGRPSTGCGDIAFGGGDVIAGPAHSNDTMRICDATFTGRVTSSNPATTGLRYTATDSTGKSCSGQKFPNSTTQPGLASTIDVPTSLTASKRQTQTGLADVPNPGCLYTGPTDIVFTSDGKMTVKSPYTKAVETNADGTKGTANAACGTPGTGSGQLGSSTGATITVPADNLIYVQNIPTTSTDVNYTASTSGLTATSCSNNHVGYPLSGETVPTDTGGYNSDNTVCAYGARSGDAFVKGQVKGKVTIATDNYIYVTGDITYTDPTSDILGLIGTNNVFVYNPVKYYGFGYYTPMLSGSNREIDAAILSSGHSFVVQNYDRGGERGTLTLNGSIAQNFRGIVHSGTNGYVKNYGYDSRLRYTAPPKFLSPVTTTYGVTTLTETKTAYAADGSAL